VRLSGTVSGADSNRPLAGAVVSITDGPQTRTNERGEWSLTNAPSGTRMIEVRAVGYYPGRQQVNVVNGSAPLRMTLSTLKAFLDTVRVTASRLPSSGNNTNGFDRRRRTTGGGKFLGPADIARFPVVVTSDLFRRISGVRIELDDMGQRHIVMRGAFAEWCEPAIFVDNHNMSFMSADDIDGLGNPRDIKGIEVYTEATTPGEFQTGLRGCGSIVIWTR
jgi:hypothetical protein